MVRCAKPLQHSLTFEALSTSVRNAPFSQGFAPRTRVRATRPQAARLNGVTNFCRHRTTIAIIIATSDIDIVVGSGTGFRSEVPP